MNAKIQELHFVLDKQVMLHRNLIDVLREEFSHMATLDLKGLAETSYAKEVLLNEIWNLEQLRIKAVEAIAPTLKLDPDTATLANLAAAIKNQDGEKLKNARTVLNMLIGQARDMNAQNMSFAEASLGRIEEMKRNALGLNNNTVKENYSNGGVREPMAEQGGRLLSTEA